MKRVMPGLAALLIYSTASATPVRFETDVTITRLTGDYLTMFGDIAVGDRVLIQVEADNSATRHQVDYRIYFGERLHELSFADWSGTRAQTANVNATTHPGERITVGMDQIVIESYPGRYRYQWGYYDRRNPSECDYECCKTSGTFEHCDYWEGAYNYVYEEFVMNLYLPDDGSSLSSLDSLYDFTNTLFGPGSYEIAYKSQDCGAYAAYGCNVAAPPSYGFGKFDARFYWDISAVRAGWTDMTAAVSAGPLAPLLGLLLWVGVRWRKRPA